MRSALLGAGWLLVAYTSALSAQLVEFGRPAAGVGTKSLKDIRASEAVTVCSSSNKVKALERGLVELFSLGGAQASTQLLRLCIGEPTGFRVPLYFFIGASGNAAGDYEANETTLANLLNPLGGNFNLTLNDAYPIWENGLHSSFSAAYQGSFKYFNAQDATDASKAVPTGALYGDVGLRFKTAAWNPNDPANVGYFWLQGKVAISAGTGDQLERAFGNAIAGSITSWSIDTGIEIGPTVNIKASLSKPARNFGIDLFKDPVFKFAFDYKPAK